MAKEESDRNAAIVYVLRVLNKWNGLVFLNDSLKMDRVFGIMVSILVCGLESILILQTTLLVLILYFVMNLPVWLTEWMLRGGWLMMG